MGGNTTCKECVHYDVCARPGVKCNEYMSAAVASGALPDLCLYNEGVCCEVKDCYRCGWAPDEIERRKAQIQAALARGETPHVSV